MASTNPTQKVVPLRSSTEFQALLSFYAKEATRLSKNGKEDLDRDDFDAMMQACGISNMPQFLGRAMSHVRNRVLPLIHIQGPLVDLEADAAPFRIVVESASPQGGMYILMRMDSYSNYLPIKGERRLKGATDGMMREADSLANHADVSPDMRKRVKAYHDSLAVLERTNRAQHEALSISTALGIDAIVALSAEMLHLKQDVENKADERRRNSGS